MTIATEALLSRDATDSEGFSLMQFARSSSWLAKVARKQILARLEPLPWGQLTLRDVINGQSFEYGTTREDEPAADIVIKQSEAWVMMGLGRDIGFGEAWAQGLWDSENLTAVLQIASHPLNAELFDTAGGALGRLLEPALNAWHRLRDNSKIQARKNISAHYDLGNRFFSQWLDTRMMYSSGIYLSDDTSLEAAQLEKIDRICRKLQLQPGHTLLEIGTGWGGFAMHAASKYGAIVTTTTISKEQAAYARAAIKAAGLENKITVIEQDYRDLSGQYDAVVSIEMIEAVGHRYLDGYFAKINQLLKPDGQAVLQAITIEDHRYEQYKYENNFINHYIFPGGCLPSITAIQSSIAKGTDMRLVHLEDFATDYAKTLLEWQHRLITNRQQLPTANQEPWFFRLWQFYLCACEALFLERRIGVNQLVFSKPQARPAPLTRI